LFSFGVATKTGPNEKILDNSRMSLTLIGYGKTSVKPPTATLKEIKPKDNTSTRKTIIKVIFINNNCVYIAECINIYIYRPTFETILYL